MPAAREAAAAYRCEDAAAPDEGEQVEHSQLARLVKLAVFGLGKVQPPVHFLQLSESRRSDEAARVQRHIRLRPQRSLCQNFQEIRHIVTEPTFFVSDVPTLLLGDASAALLIRYCSRHQSLRICCSFLRRFLLLL